MKDMPETDLVKIAERDVIAKAKAWLAAWRNESRDPRRAETLSDAQCEVLSATILLETREEITKQKAA